MALFAGHEALHGTHGLPDFDPDHSKWGIKRTARTMRTPPTLDLWEMHLRGEKPLGVCPIRGDNMCLWGSGDIDEYAINLLEVVAQVEASKYPLVPCRSKSGGLHLFLFLAEPVPAGVVRATLKEMMSSLGFASCEIYPAQSELLTERGDQGNWMVMPYFGGTFEGRLKTQVGLKKTGAEMTVSEFLGVAEKARVTAEDLSRVHARRGPRRGRNGHAAVPGNPPDEPFGDGPPCLQHLAKAGFQQGGRDNSLFMIGVYLKRAAPTDWQQQLEAHNQTYMHPPLSSDEVQGVIRSLARKDYNYTCRKEPMASYCNAALCRTRQYGVGEEGSYPMIASLSKLGIEPAIWFVDIEGERLEATTEQLQNYVLFHRLCLEKGRCYGTMKQADWFVVLSEAMRSMTVIDAPSDVGTAGRFRELLEEFLTNRSRGEREEDLLSGRPWLNEEEGRHYFKLTPFQTFLMRENVREFSRGQITRRIEAMGGGHKFRLLKGKGCNTWWVPASALVPDPEYDTPKIKEEPI